ncbi:MAG: acylphosphatase [Bryobacteraceae bacterium]
MPHKPEPLARRYRITGRVQGVGFRNFVQHAASGLGLSGYAKNLPDGSVEVYAIGEASLHSELSAALHTGPRWADVRSVHEQEAALEACSGFRIR